MSTAVRCRKDIPMITTDKGESRKERLRALLKLTNEITSTFKKEKGGVCKKPLNGFPDPPKRPYGNRVPANRAPPPPQQYYNYYNNYHNYMNNQYKTTTLPPNHTNAVPNGPRRSGPSRMRRQVPTQGATRGPALNPTMAYRAMMKLCDQLEQDVITSACGDYGRR